LLSLLVSACATKIETRTEYVPVYLVVQPERPEPPSLEPLDWFFLQEEGYFVLTVDEFDKYRNNLVEIYAYIVKLHRNLEFYERTTSKPSGDILH